MKHSQEKSRAKKKNWFLLKIYKIMIRMKGVSLKFAKFTKDWVLWLNFKSVN